MDQRTVGDVEHILSNLTTTPSDEDIQAIRAAIKANPNLLSGSLMPPWVHKWRKEIVEVCERLDNEQKKQGVKLYELTRNLHTPPSSEEVKLVQEAIKAWPQGFSITQYIVWCDFWRERGYIDAEPNS